MTITPDKTMKKIEQAHAKVVAALNGRQVNQGKNRIILDQNREIRLENAKIRQKNEKIKDSNKKIPLIPTLRLKPLEKKHQVVLDKEADTKAMLKRRKPSVWLNKVEQIQRPWLRKKIACLVWWDFFSERMSGNAWDHLNHYIGISDTDRRATQDEVIPVLVRLGYTEHMAWSRITGMNGRKL